MDNKYSIHRFFIISYVQVLCLNIVKDINPSYKDGEPLPVLAHDCFSISNHPCDWLDDIFKHVYHKTL